MSISMIFRASSPMWFKISVNLRNCFFNLMFTCVKIMVETISQFKQLCDFTYSHNLFKRTILKTFYIDHKFPNLHLSKPSNTVHSIWANLLKESLNSTIVCLWIQDFSFSLSITIVMFFIFEQFGVDIFHCIFIQRQIQFKPKIWSENSKTVSSLIK